jgi:hypothetical protein
MTQMEPKILMGSEVGRRNRGKLTARGDHKADTAWQFLQKLVLVGLIQPGTEELKRVILTSPPTGPDAT